MSKIEKQEILFNQLPGCKGDIGEICLNRPLALNALTKNMCKNLQRQLQQWQKDPKIKAVIIRGMGDRAFCAGGDVKSLCQFKNHADAAMEFFRCEYNMNKAIYHFNKPYIALLDGITMGGGVGVSLHGSHAVATEKFLFAMPETAIGFFPDVGVAYLLNKLPDKIGLFLALTGMTLTLSAAMDLGLVHHGVKSGAIKEIIAELCDTPYDNNSFSSVTAILNRYSLAMQKSELTRDRELIKSCFSLASVAEIMQALQKLATPATKKWHQTLLARSPLALKVSYAHFHRAAHMGFDDIMQMDFNVAYGFMQSNDFFEGVRAMLVDKDKSPHWDPKSLQEIDEPRVESFFKMYHQL